MNSLAPTLFDVPDSTPEPASPPTPAEPEQPAPAPCRIVLTRAPNRLDPQRRPQLLAVVACPFCDAQHIHPAGVAGQPRLGVRRSRCIARPARLYVLAVA